MTIGERINLAIYELGAALFLLSLGADYLNRGKDWWVWTTVITAGFNFIFFCRSVRLAWRQRKSRRDSLYGTF